jgi:phospholipase/carboxylesterase
MSENEIPTFDGPRLHPQSGAAAKQLVILLHGLGADGNDLFALAPQFAAVLPDATFVSPHAPFACDMAPVGYQWFSFQEQTPESVRAGVDTAAPILNAFIDTELARNGLDEEALALVGFSQGTMMSLHVALRRPKAVAAVVGFSGSLVDPASLASEMTSKPPLLLIHGDADPIVPVDSHYEAVSSLLTAGLNVESHIRPELPHSIDEAGLNYAKEFLVKNFHA